MIEDNDLPMYLEIKENHFGLGTYSKKQFKKGELIMKSRARAISNSEFENRLFFESKIQYKKYYLETKKCTSRINGIVYLYEKDAFINHSCNPNIFTEDLYFIENFMYYNKYALRDIENGEELVTNYLFFENESDYEFNCKCNNDICFGVIKGRNHLNFEQLNLLSKQKL